MKLIKMLLKMKKHLSCVVSKGFFFLIIIIIIIVLIIRTLLLPESWGFNHDDIDTVSRVKYLEVPQIVWGLNNQKIGFARACLTARFLNRTLLMPSLSATLFYKETNQLQPISFDKVFQFDKFNSLCKGFVQLGRYSDLQNHRNSTLVVQKGSGRRWTVERDIDQLKELRKNHDEFETIQLVGKNPFLWHDHFPVKDYAKVFECLVLVEEISKEADKVVGKIREYHHLGSKNGYYYVAVHMRIEKDWMIHCKKLQQRSNVSDICSSKQEMMSRVANIQGLKTPTVVYLAVAADALVEEDDGLMMNGWKEVGLVAVEKKRLGVVEIYKKHPYLIQAAIDYEVCSRADVFVGNSYSTFSSLLVLQRSLRRYYWPCFAYNLKAMEGSAGARPWRTSLSGSSLQAISYGTNNISC